MGIVNTRRGNRYGSTLVTELAETPMPTIHTDKGLPILLPLPIGWGEGQGEGNIACPLELVYNLTGAAKMEQQQLTRFR
jgi:hypothetical protein